MVYIPQQRSGGELSRPYVRHHFCVIRRYGDPPWSPLRWRVRCSICFAQWAAPEADLGSWLLALCAASRHTLTGQWPDGESRKKAAPWG